MDLETPRMFIFKSKSLFHFANKSHPKISGIFAVCSWIGRSLNLWAWHPPQISSAIVTSLDLRAKPHPLPPSPSKGHKKGSQLIAIGILTLLKQYLSCVTYDLKGYDKKESVEGLRPCLLIVVVWIAVIFPAFLVVQQKPDIKSPLIRLNRL